MLKQAYTTQWVHMVSYGQLSIDKQSETTDKVLGDQSGNDKDLYLVEFSPCLSRSNPYDIHTCTSVAVESTEWANQKDDSWSKAGHHQCIDGHKNKSAMMTWVRSAL